MFWQENKWMKQFLEEEQKSRKELERVVRKLAKQKNDCSWDDAGHWVHPYNHPHPRCVSVWMAIYFCKHACGGTGEGSSVCMCVCVCVRQHLFSVFASPYFNHAEQSGTCLWASSLQVLEHDVTCWWNLSSWSSLTRWDHKYMQLR